MTTRGCGSSSRLQIHGRCRLAAGGRSATKQGSITPVAAKVNYDEATKTVTLDPVNKLATSKVYTTKISGVKDGGQQARRQGVVLQDQAQMKTLSRV